MLKNLVARFLKLFEHDITSEIKERVTNPFFVSLILSWSAWNWKLLYMFFNFSNDYDLNYRTYKIDEYLKKVNYSDSLALYPILTAFSAIIIFGFLIQFSLLISVFFKRKIRPLVYKYVGYKDVVDIETHNQIKRRLFDVQQAFGDKEIELSNFSADNKNLRIEKEELNGKIVGYRTQIDESEKKLNENFNKYTLNGLFNGAWQNDYILEDGRAGSEPVIIKEGNKYIANGKHIFNLDMIEVDRKTKKIKFRKVGIEGDDRVVFDDLQMINENEYFGIEGRNTLVRYTKYDSEINNFQFIASYMPNIIKVNGKSRIVFHFKNNLTIGLEIISYQFFPIVNKKRLIVYDKHPFKFTVEAGKELTKEFQVVSPFEEYFRNNVAEGIYDSEICIEYRVDGNVDVKTITRIARLVVQKEIIVNSATFGSGTNHIEVTEKVRAVVNQNIYKMMIPDYSNGNPSITQKVLNVDFTVNGVKKIVGAPMGSVLNFDI